MQAVIAAARDERSRMRPSSPCTARCCTRATDQHPARRRSAARRRRRRDAGGLGGDVTREPGPSRGRFSPTQRDVYDAVLAAQAAALATVRPGVRLPRRAPGLAARAARAADRLGSCAAPSTTLLECPCRGAVLPPRRRAPARARRARHGRPGRPRRLRAGPDAAADASRRFLRLDRDLEPGMVVTIEPGFYQIPDLLRPIDPEGPLGRALDRDRLAAFHDVRGIRIEDDVLVTEVGHEVLSDALPNRPGYRSADGAIASGSWRDSRTTCSRCRAGPFRRWCHGRICASR